VPLTFGVLAAVAASSSASNDVSPGVLGFLVVAAMGVALVFLLKSMNKQFRKIEPKPEGTTGLEGAKGSEGAEGSKPGRSETPAPDAPK
jgi:hypothetical protein